jgi:hypothetical protein
MGLLENYAWDILRKQLRTEAAIMFLCLRNSKLSLFLISCGGLRLSPLGTSVTI